MGRNGLLRDHQRTGLFPRDNLMSSPFWTLAIMSSITLLLRVRANAWLGRAAIVLGELSSRRPSAGIRRTISTAGIEMVSSKSGVVSVRDRRRSRYDFSVLCVWCRGGVLAPRSEGASRPKSTQVQPRFGGAGEGVTSSGRRRRMRVSATREGNSETRLGRQVQAAMVNGRSKRGSKTRRRQT